MEREKAVEVFNRTHRHRKRGISLTATKFGISFTAKFMNQVDFNGSLAGHFQYRGLWTAPFSCRLDGHGHSLQCRLTDALF
jgi:hypothetical protein